MRSNVFFGCYIVSISAQNAHSYSWERYSGMTISIEALQWQTNKATIKQNNNKNEKKKKIKSINGDSERERIGNKNKNRPLSGPSLSLLHSHTVNIDWFEWRKRMNWRFIAMILITINCTRWLIRTLAFDDFNFFFCFVSFLRFSDCAN